MRIFTIDEQTLLTHIRDGQGRNLYSLIDPWINGVSFQVNTQNNSVDFIFDANLEHNLIDRLKEIQEIVIQSVNLIKLFEEKGYIFTYIGANQLPPNPFTFGQAAINTPSIPYHFPDPRISKLFCEYSIKDIYVTPELNRFITDGFITREEYRANRQWRTTMAALGVTVLALLLNVHFNIRNIKEQKALPSLAEDNDIKIMKSLPTTEFDTTITSDTLTVIKTTTTITNIQRDTIRK